MIIKRKFWCGAAREGKEGASFFDSGAVLVKPLKP
jgi:hypothetical protein